MRFSAELRFNHLARKYILRKIDYRIERACFKYLACLDDFARRTEYRVDFKFFRRIDGFGEFLVFVQALKLVVSLGKRIVLEAESICNVFNVGYGFAYQQFLIGNFGRADLADDYVAEQLFDRVYFIFVFVLSGCVDNHSHSVEYF